MKNIFDYIEGKSIFHRLNPVTKLFFAICVSLACFISSSIIYLVILILIDILAGIISGIIQRTLYLLKGLFKISMFLFILQLFFVRSGKTIFVIANTISITDEGVFNALRLVLRLTGATLPLSLMLSVTKLTDLTNALVEVLHVPYKYAFTLNTAIRFVPLFAQEMSGIIEAQSSRGVELDTKNPLKKIKLILPLCVPLLVSSVRKTESTAIAADLRGFDLRKRSSCYKEYKFKFLDLIITITGVSLLVINKFI